MLYQKGYFNLYQQVVLVAGINDFIPIVSNADSHRPNRTSTIVDELSRGLC